MIVLKTLTTRENEVLTLVAAGKRNTQIAKKLCIAEHTVEAHLTNIFRKLNVRNRTAAAQQFWRLQSLISRKS